jgi:hypothetical protein
MDQLAKGYVQQGYPPIQEFCFSMPQSDADLLVGEGMIELVALDQWGLTGPGHHFCMSRKV